MKQSATHLVQLKESLTKWSHHARTYCRESVALPGSVIYGQGNDAWGVQTQQKAFAAYAVLAKQGLADVDTALALLRFNLASHVTGAITCTDGVSWGHSWISVLGIERMMFALEDLWDVIPRDDRAALKRVMISEAEWLLDHYEIKAGLVAANKPESNIWNGAFLHRVAMMWPQYQRAAECRNKGTHFLINGISIASDACSPKVLDACRVAQAHVGPNFFPSFSLNHHGYLNIGYMVICLSNIALFHFSAQRKGQAAPESLYHHAQELWELVKACTFDDGRLWRIGGDTRVRYCYCQDYVLPMWAWVEDYLGEPCSAWIQAWLRQVAMEQAENEDGAYLGKRLSTLKSASPLYYTRLESDRAASLAALLSWGTSADADKKSAQKAMAQTSRLSAWQDTFHGAMMTRGAKRMASFTWLAAEGPTATATAPHSSDMVEWGGNGLGRIQSLGFVPHYTLISHGQCGFQGGFATGGVCTYAEAGFLVDSQAGSHDLATIVSIAVALPDDRRMVLLQRCFATQFMYLKKTIALHWTIPNDVFNGHTRSYLGSSGQWQPTRGQASHSQSSPWWLVDDHWGIASLTPQALTLSRAAERAVGIKAYSFKQHAAQAGGCLYTDLIGIPESYDTPRGIEAGTVIHESMVLIDTACSRDDVANIVQTTRHQQRHGLEVLEFTAADGQGYRLSANLSMDKRNAGWPTAPWQEIRPCPHGQEVTANNSAYQDCLGAPGSLTLEKLP